MRTSFPFRSVARVAMHAMLVLAVLELAARTADMLRWGAPFLGDYSEEMLFVNDSLGYHLRPSAQYEKWQIDSLGFRSPEVTMARPAGVTRIITVGASETFGLYESPGKEWPAQLQLLLDQRYPGRFQVLNAAIPGISPSRIEHYFESWLVRFQPDIVILYPTPSFMLPASSGAASPAPATRAAMLSIPAFSPRIVIRATESVRRVLPRRLQTEFRQWLIDRAVRRHPPDWVLTSVPPDRVAAFRNQLVAFAQLVRRNGAALVMATHGSRLAGGQSADEKDLLIAWRALYPNRSEACLMESETLANHIVSEVGVQYDIPVADVETAVPKSPRYFADMEHFTDDGAALVAQSFFEKVVALSPRRNR